MDNSSKQDEQVMTLVATALKLDETERVPFLKAACGEDEQLYGEAVEVLEWEGRMGGFLNHPMIALQVPDLPFAPGEIVCERFQIDRKIGEGGMGVVYEALDQKRNQKIAIKAAKPGFGRLLSPELEGALRVRHPNVCLVNEIHTAHTAQGDIDFLTMELLEGETLAARFARDGKLDKTEAQDIAQQLCAGLQEAHKSGVIHRDFKSSNVILCRNRSGGLRAVITDFGLSGEADKAGFFGTQRYMAPELLLGEKASKATDIYALGVVLYEIVEKGSPVYQRLVEDFLSLDPEKRLHAFETAREQLARRTMSRRQLLGVGVGAAAALAGVGWWERDKIVNWLEPLPRKRFVALLAWPPDMDLQLKPMVSGVVDAIENELSRAEAIDRDLFVIPARNAVDPHESGWLGKLGESLGVNLALQASGVQTAREFGLLLRLLDTTTGTLLRQHQIVCPRAEIGLLATKAVSAAAGLLNVHWDPQGVDRLRPSTDSVIALQAFQEAEELRKKPNDDGLVAAIESYKKAIDADSKYAGAYARLAMAYNRLNAIHADPGVTELTRSNAAKAIALDPSSVNGHLALALVFESKGDFNQAIAQIHQALQLDPTNPRTISWQGYIFSEFRRWKEAEQTYRLLEGMRPNYWIVHNELGLLLANIGNYNEAIIQLRAAVAAAPRETLPLSNLGLYQFKLGDISAAENTLRRSLAIKPSPLALLYLGGVLRVQGKFAKAIHSCREAVNLNPSDDENWMGLGDCFEAANAHREASEAFEKAAIAAKRQIEEDSKDSAARMRLAFYTVKRHASNEVWSLLQRAEEHGELEIDLQILKARILELGGKHQEALDVITATLKRAPVRFEIENIQDFHGLTKDPAYVRALNGEAK